VSRALLLLIALLLLAGGHPPALRADVVHIVRRSETAYSIARHYGVPPRAVLAANRLTPHSALRVGQHLVIPGVHAASPASRPHGAASAVHAHAPAHPGHASAAAPAPSTPSLAPSAGTGAGGDDAQAQRYLFITGRTKMLIDSATPQRGRWRYIVFHHSGTPSGNAKIFDYFHRNVRHMENGLAYHFVIGNGHGSGDGEIEVGGRWLKQLQGGHLHSEALNQIALGVCFVGDFDKTRPSRKQIAAAIELTSYLRAKCGPPDLIFKAHREINPRPTECPGKLFPVAAFHKLFD
jgi:LysM repeat protein